MQFVQGSRALFGVLGRCRVLSVKGQIRFKSQTSFSELFLELIG